MTAQSESPHTGASKLVPRPPNRIVTHQPYAFEAASAQSCEASGHGERGLADLPRIVRKHMWTLLLAIVLGCGAAVVHTLLSSPVYRSTVVFQIDRADGRVAGFPKDPGREGPGGDDASLMRTQQELLKSRTLAERVIDELHLDQPSFPRQSDVSQAAGQRVRSDGAVTGEAAAIGAYLHRMIEGYRRLTQPSVRDAHAAGRQAVVNRFLATLNVEPVRGSRLVKLHVDHTDPALAARIANTTVQVFVATGMERRLESSAYAKGFLEDQIRQVKAKLEESERRLNAYAQAHETLSLDEKTNVVNQTYMEFAGALAKAEQNRIRAEAIATEMQRNPQSSSAVVDNKIIQAYKEQRAQLEIEYQQNLRIYKTEFPKMQQIKARLAELDTHISQEIAATTGAVHAHRDAAAKQESLLRERLRQTRDQVLTAQDRGIDLKLLKREADTNRQLYDNLLQRFKELEVSSNIDRNTVTVVDDAKPALFPFQPRLRTNLLGGLLAALVAGAILIVMIELLDQSVVHPERVEPLFGLPLLGIVPKLGRRQAGRQAIALQVQDAPRSMIAEAYRSVGAALQVREGPSAKRIVVTSAARGEGKSTTSLALAIHFAQLGRKVLLIDADLRCPSIHTLLGMSNRMGLSNLLAGGSGGARMIRSTQIPGMSVLTAGPMSENPVDLLSGPSQRLILQVAAQEFDHVIVDAPPVLGLADAIVLGKQLQNVLFVVRAGSTRKAVIRYALRRLAHAGLVPRGLLLTQAMDHGLSYTYETYFGSGYRAPVQRVALGFLRPAQFAAR